MMELGELLAGRGNYSGAVLSYEELFERLPESPHCPEALYRAIMIYKDKVPDTKRAQQLADILKSEYPESRYSSLLGN